MLQLLSGLTATVAELLPVGVRPWLLLLALLLAIPVLLYVRLFGHFELVCRWIASALPSTSHTLI